MRIGWSNQSLSILIDGLWVKLPVKGRHEVTRYTGPVNRAGFVVVVFLLLFFDTPTTVFQPIYDLAS